MNIIKNLFPLFGLSTCIFFELTLIMSTKQATEIALAINRVMKLDAQDQLSMQEVITDYFTLPTLDDEPEFDEDNFDELDDYDGDSSSFITSNLADRTMRELSEQNAAGKKTYKMQ